MAKIIPERRHMPEEQAPAPRTKILHVTRAPGEFRSIEGLFGAIARSLPGEYEVETLAAPRRGAGIGSILANLRWAARLPKAGLAHVTGDIHYAVLSIWRRPVVLTIHDLRFFEQARGLKRLIFWWWWLYLPCLRAGRVTVISEQTKARLMALCRVNPAKIRVIPNCVAPEFCATPKSWPSGKPCVLQVGTTDNKNLQRVIDACAGLSLQLSILGKLTAAQREELQRQGVDYEEFSDLAAAEVVSHYVACDVVLFASTYEGFGLPIIEAQAVGRPVITSNLSPMREVAGGAALLVDPYSPEDIRAALLRLFEDAGLRETLISAGFRNVRQYGAPLVARQYAEVYREVMG
jgi:glycosyltransferase involved in cell wall biosynthesis